MPTYATRADCLAYTEGLVVEDNAAFDRLIERAEDDIDNIAGPLPVDEGTGRKFVPANMSTGSAAALRRATCAQAEYRVEMGEAFFTRAQFPESSGPDFSRKGTLPYFAPKAARELRSTGLLRATGARATA